MAWVAMSLCSGCIPYTVGSTARTVLPGITERTTSVYVVPDVLPSLDSNHRAALAVDVEMRRGVDEVTDVGFRVASASGVTATLKRRFDSGQGAAVAWMLGAGLMNVGQHGFGEASLLFSGDERSSYQPYGGIRVMGVVPIGKEAVSDEPVAGAFFGIRIGDFDFSVMPEIGVFYDRSALKLRTRNWIVVPGFTIASRPTRRRVSAITGGDQRLPATSKLHLTRRTRQML